MELGEQNLSEIIIDRKGNPFTEEEIRKTMKSLLEAVDHMHDKGYIHRDLKPE